jgi:hypothetical protein
MRLRRTIGVWRDAGIMRRRVGWAGRWRKSRSLTRKERGVRDDIVLMEWRLNLEMSAYGCGSGVQGRRRRLGRRDEFA